MTTILRRVKKCALCHQTSKQIVIGSTNTTGKYPDLDTRPPEMIRSTIQWWIQTCPVCGYCDYDISQMIKKADEVVKTERYQKQLNEKRYPILADAFLCRALIHENNDEYREAGWACIHAAWACDDAGSEECSRKCRQKALAFIKNARGLNQRFSSQPGAEESLTVDLLRRSGQFELALTTCKEALAQGFDDTISVVLRLEKVLIEKRDSQCHTVSEINNLP